MRQVISVADRFWFAAPLTCSQHGGRRVALLCGIAITSLRKSACTLASQLIGWRGKERETQQQRQRTQLALRVRLVDADQAKWLCHAGGASLAENATRAHYVNPFHAETASVDGAALLPMRTP
jgi:hypothetical protein